MNTHKPCCVGHITLDRVVTPKNTVHMPGGTSFYFSHAIKHFDGIGYTLVTALAKSEVKTIGELRAEGINAAVMPSKHIVYFENIYGESQNNRTQRVLAKAGPFTVEYLENINSKIFHLGSLSVDDFSLEVVKYLAGKGLVSVDPQGYLREVRDKDVSTVDWSEKKEVLKYVYFLKTNEYEMEVLTGYTDAVNTGKVTYDWGVKEVLLTFGSIGSVIYDGSTFHKIPAYILKEVVNATGTGDTYMTGYPHKYAKGVSIGEAGRFVAAMITLKIEGMGPFGGTKKDVLRCLETVEQRVPE